MIVIKKSNYNASRYAHDQYDNSDIINYDTDFNQVINCLNGRVRFGPGTSGNDGENMAGKFLTITTNVTPDTESTFTHGMGSIPVGYIVIWQSKAGSLYQGPTTGTKWTSSAISLKCSVASVQFSLFLLM
jgi:hypothetical protein